MTKKKMQVATRDQRLSDLLGGHNYVGRDYRGHNYINRKGGGNDQSAGRDARPAAVGSARRWRRRVAPSVEARAEAARGRAHGAEAREGETGAVPVYAVMAYVVMAQEKQIRDRHCLCVCARTSVHSCACLCPCERACVARARMHACVHVFCACLRCMSAHARNSRRSFFSRSRSRCSHSCGHPAARPIRFFFVPPIFFCQYQHRLGTWS